MGYFGPDSPASVGVSAPIATPSAQAEALPKLGTQAAAFAAAAGVWTPVPAFATMGDAVLTVTTAQTAGEHVVIGSFCWVFFRLTFDTNAFTTASGQFRISGLPYAGAGTNVAKSFRFGHVSKVTIPSGYFDVYGSISGSQINLGAIRTANTVSTAGIDAITPSQTGIRLEGQFVYRIGE